MRDRIRCFVERPRPRRPRQSAARRRRMRSKAWAALAVGCLLAGGAAAQQGQVNVICSVQADWCNLIQTVFAKTTGVKVNMSLKGSGEALAQLIAERANPKTDVWFGGTGDPHLQAAEQDLTLEYKSARCRSCTPGRSSRRSSRATRRSASTPGRSASATTPSCSPRRSWRCRRAGPTCSSPSTRARSRSPTRPSSGTAYTMVATLVQLMGEDKAFDYLKGLHRNVSPYTRSGTGADQGGGARRDRGLDQLRARRPGREDAGLPGRDDHACRRHRRRDRLDVDPQGREATSRRRRSSTNGR